MPTLVRMNSSSSAASSWLVLVFPLLVLVLVLAMASFQAPIWAKTSLWFGLGQLQPLGQAEEEVPEEAPLAAASHLQ